MRARLRLLTVAVTVVLSSIAADAAAAETEQPVPKSRTLEPLHVDVKLTGNADALLTFVGAGAAADVGVVKAGPGTLSLGAAGEYDFCGSVCWAFSALTPMEFGQSQVSLWGRAAYHIELKGKSVEK